MSTFDSSRCVTDRKSPSQTETVEGIADIPFAAYAARKEFRTQQDSFSKCSLVFTIDWFYGSKLLSAYHFNVFAN